jgi:hypothetical protein
MLKIARQGRIINKKWFDFVDSVEEKIVENWHDDGCKGYFLADDKFGAFGILWLREWKGDLRSEGILSHELHHAVQILLGDFRGMHNETEGLAYQYEYLFTQVLGKIRKIWRGR